ncbi:MAG: pyridoxal phosphate-dependent aminotransferase [Clostridia bacterium]|nr:pyridoxal phosphate-dependent aminotransferase [Clostridia bacterium]
MFNKVMQKLGEERSVIREIFEYGNARKKQIGAENVFDFSLGNPSVPAPDCVREEIERLVKETPSANLHGYTSAAGDPGVRAAVANYIQSSFGVAVPAELIYMTCGAAASLTITLNALFEKDDEFVVITPCFPEYRVFIERAGGKVVTAKSDKNFHLDLSTLKKSIGKNTKAVILNSPNNPTGAVYSAEEIKGLAALLEEKSKEKGAPIFLISDEPYRELVYGTQVPYVMNYYENTIVCYSFSKSLSLAGERIGYIAIHPACVGAEDLFAAVCGAGRSLGYVCAPALFQKVCAKCLGKSSDISVYDSNRKLLYGALTDMGYACILPEGAFYLFMKSPEPDAKAFCERAKKYELLLVPSDSFGVEGYVRISYCVDSNMIRRALPAFEKLAKEYFTLRK